MLPVGKIIILPTRRNVMEKIWRHFFEKAILVFVLCLTGLAMSTGTSYARQCVTQV